jgi:hypothetical protein
MENATTLSTAIEPYTFRIQATGEAQKRTRSAFLVATIVSLAVLVACWNAYASWYRHFAHKKYWLGSLESNNLLSPTVPASPPESIPVPQELHRLTLERWVDSQQISVPILGITIGVSDIAVLGSLGLFLAAFWLYHALRRENQAIGHLLIETQHLGHKDRDQIFHFHRCISGLHEHRRYGNSHLYFRLFCRPTKELNVRASSIPPNAFSSSGNNLSRNRLRP